MKLKTIVLIIIIIVLCLIFIPRIVSSATIGTVEKGKCIELYQICENCTYNNISTILYPNKSVAASNIEMSNDTETYYNYTFCSTNLLGDYIINGFGDLDGVKTSWVYDMEVTGTGFEFNEAKSSYYLGLLALLVFFFVVTIVSITKLPGGNNTDDYGRLISINHLKYLRPVLIVVAWIILLGITFTASNVALAYMGSEMFGQLFFAIYQVMFWLTLPALFIWFIFIFVSIFRDREMKRMLERGIDVGGI
jgi:hypothetical protein